MAQPELKRLVDDEPTKKAGGTRTTRRSAKTPPVCDRAEITFSLFDPRYDFHQRLGLGNLALACKRLQDDGVITAEDWSLSPMELRLGGKWREIIRSAYLLAFQLRDGLIYSPITHVRGRTPETAVLAQLHNQMCETVFWAANNVIRYAKVPKLDKDGNKQYETLANGGKKLIEKRVPKQQEVADYDGSPVEIQYNVVAGYRLHNEERVDDLIAKFDLSIPYTCNDMPGVMESQPASNEKTSPMATGSEVLLMDLSHVGVVTITWRTVPRVGKVKYSAAAAYLEFDNLVDYVKIRPLLTPTTVKECHRDGVNQAVHSYLRLMEIGDAASFRGCHVVTFGKQPWTGPSFVTTDMQWFDYDEIDPSKNFVINTIMAALPHRRMVKDNPNNPSKFRDAIRSTILLNVWRERPLFQGVFQIPATLNDFQDVAGREGDGLAMVAEHMKQHEFDLIDAMQEAIRRKKASIYACHPGNLKAGHKAYDKWQAEVLHALKTTKSQRDVMRMVSRLFGEYGSDKGREVCRAFVERMNGGKSDRDNDITSIYYLALMMARGKKAGEEQTAEATAA